MEKIILLGSGGHAKAVVDSIETGGEYKIVGFLSKENDDYEYRGYTTLGTDEKLLELYQQGVRNVCLSMGYLGNGDVRQRLYRKVKDIGFQLPSIVDASAVIAFDVRIGEGCYIGKRAIINADSNIGKMVIVNTGAIVGHDSRIDDFSHIAPGCVLCGATTVGKSTFIGANTTVLQNVKIGEHVIIGANSLILGNIDHYSKVIGVHKSTIL